jgi:nardilysin
MWSSRSQDAGGCRWGRTLPAGAHSDEEEEEDDDEDEAEDDDDELGAGVDGDPAVEDDESDDRADEPESDSDDVAVAGVEPADFDVEAELRLSVL